MNIAAPKVPASYAEIGQSLNVLFAWAVKTEDGFQLQHSYVKCRDFLPDFLWMIYNNSKGKTDTNQGIYGYKHQSHHVKSPYMALKLDMGSIDALKYNIENYITGIEFVGNDGSQAIVKWDDEAMDAPWKISFFTFMLKLCCVKKATSFEKLMENGDSYSPEDTYILSVGKNVIDQLLNHWSKIEDPDMLIGSPVLQALDISTMHNYTGFVSQFKKSSKSKLVIALKEFA